MKQKVFTVVVGVFFGIVGTIIFQTAFQIGRFSEKDTKFQNQYNDAMKKVDDAMKTVDSQKQEIARLKEQSLNGTLYRGSNLVWNSDIELSFETLEELRDQPAKTYQGKQGILVIKEVKKNTPVIDRNSIEFTATYTVNTEVK
jgi:hypothetical protein